MKLKIDWKLTICVVSLFIGILLLAFLFEHKVARFFGIFIMAISLFLFSRIRSKKMDKVLEQAEKDLEEEIKKENKDSEFLTQLHLEMEKYKRQKRSMVVSFTTFSAMLVVVAIVSLL